MTGRSIARHFMMLNTMTKNENTYHDLRPRPKRKDGNISETFALAFHDNI